jgi:hypothetical protein
MSKLHNQKTELETLRAQWRTYYAENPNDAGAAQTLRQVESQLATVAKQIIHGPGARAVVNAAIGRASIAAQRNQGAPSSPVPAPMQSAAPTPTAAPSFVSETDVPYPPRTPSAGEDLRRQNGRRAAETPADLPAAPQPPAAQVPAAPTVANTEPPADAPAAPRYLFQSETDVPYPIQPRSHAAQIVRENGRR